MQLSLKEAKVQKVAIKADKEDKTPIATVTLEVDFIKQADIGRLAYFIGQRADVLLVSEQLSLDVEEDESGHPAFVPERIRQ